MSSAAVGVEPSEDGAYLPAWRPVLHMPEQISASSTLVAFICLGFFRPDIHCGLTASLFDGANI